VSVRVKICGVTSVVDAALAVQLGADLIGLNFYPPSPRYLSLDVALQIRAMIPPQVQCVGVFVNAERQHISQLIEQLQLDIVQFHGDESGDVLLGWPCKTIKAVRVSSEDNLLDVEHIPTDYILLDTYKAGQYGGTGETFSWRRIVSAISDREHRLILAGGLTPENVALAVRTVYPWAVDVASGVEAAPGRKDQDKMRAFITNAKTA